MTVKLTPREQEINDMLAGVHARLDRQMEMIQKIGEVVSSVVGAQAATMNAVNAQAAQLQMLVQIFGGMAPNGAGSVEGET